MSNCLFQYIIAIAATEKNKAADSYKDAYSVDRDIRESRSRPKTNSS